MNLKNLVLLVQGNLHRILNSCPRCRIFSIDFFVEFKNGAKFLVEIKPYSQTKKPILRKNPTRYKDELITYYINQAKWKAAKDFAEKRNMKFIVLTEREL